MQHRGHGSAVGESDARTDGRQARHTYRQHQSKQIKRGGRERTPIGGEGSYTGVAKSKAGVAKRRAQWVHSTLCACRLESPDLRLETPV